ncbi:MAG: hypothetical protein H6816_11125 [Phycisphaerales bacterium]|nr:hypothetical protein [Phycisphaerales bacterium]
MAHTAVFEFDAPTGEVRGTLDGTTVDVPLATVAYRTLLHHCPDLAHRCQLCFERVDDALAVDLQPLVKTVDAHRPIRIDGDDALAIYHCLFPPGHDPLLPAVTDVYMNR